MLTFLAEHRLAFQILTGLLAVALASLVLWVSLRAERDPDTARHRGRRRAWRLRAHQPRHAAPTYYPHHATADAGPGVFLGRSPDGDLVLVDDEHAHELVGASA